MKYALSILYILNIIISNFFASTVLLNYNGLITLIIGTLTFGFVFVLRDILHKYGKNYVYLLIVISVILSTLFNIVTNTPLQIVAASAIGLFIGEAVDTEIFQNLKNKSWIIRALSSNSISVPIDSLLFNYIAFYGSELQGQKISLTIADIIYKFITAGFVSYSIYKSKLTT